MEQRLKTKDMKWITAVMAKMRSKSKDASIASFFILTLDYPYKVGIINM